MAQEFFEGRGVRKFTFIAQRRTFPLFATFRLCAGETRVQKERLLYEIDGAYDQGSLRTAYPS